METTESPPLDSLFPELRDLPRQPPRREMLAGLHWKAVLRSPLALLLPLLLIFALLPFVIFAATSAQRSSTQRIMARVIQVERVGGNQVFVKYRFTASGKTYTGSNVSQGNSSLQNLREGESLPVRFQISNPTDNAPVVNEVTEAVIWPMMLFFPLLALFFFAPWLAPQLRAIWMARTLLSRGNLANGRVKFIKSTAQPTPFTPGGAAQIFYEFNDENGALQKGTMKCDNAWLVGQFHVGSPVVVAYNPRKPAQNVVLEPFVA